MLLKIILISLIGLTHFQTTSLDLRGVVNGDRMGSVPLGRSLGAGELDVEGICTKPGMACQNCSLAVTCVKLPVGWLKLPLEECSGGQTCNAHEGGCSTQPVPECDADNGYRHYCEQVGIFPDGHDCRKFHLCSPPDGLPNGRPADHRAALCPRHYGYNPQSAQCSVNLENGQCKEKVIPDCTKVGAFGVLSTSDNYYYVCMKKHKIIHPQVLVCPHGWHFWDDGYCRPEPRPNKGDKSSSESNSSEAVAIDVEPTSKTSTSREPSTDKSTTTRIEAFFSTEKATTYAADTFLADKFDLTNYESTDDVQQNNEFNSFENNNEWDF